MEFPCGVYMEQDNMTYEEAVEFIEYNTLRSIPYCSNAPIVVHMIEDYFVNRQ